MILNKIIRTTANKLNNKIRLISTIKFIEPKSERKLALPITFLLVKDWDNNDIKDKYLNWANKFSTKGYTSLLIEIDSNDLIPKPIDSKSLLDQLETKLTSMLAGSKSPFPPLLISSNLSSLLAQTYVSSHPLSGLLLNSPSTTLEASQSFPTIFPTPIQDFDYEPHFNLAVMESKEEDLKGRLLEEYGELEDKGKVVGLIGELDDKGWEIVMDWMDESGL